MEPIRTYLNQIINNDLTQASETLQAIIKQRVAERFQDAKNEVKKK